ncbi:sigma-70 family RNA polymerase sigma factor [Lentisphaera profundi]|uniref:Sigma-70 family RNA polymerase sigma factor n=1 Tax=Lentisphaera profundi TaxID=1658616 RepID=A0ABY7VQD9_9BACT|nr:sigma-70 family RNA polymerase sigma factor [Lentisphaera profundi]WDE96410.1 sigma-70 family RNA polymerase sigma factor [Lentisphaera profundi]
MDINSLLSKSRQGDTEAYRLIIRELAPSVRAFLLSRLNDYHAVEDISQEIFVAAYRSLDKFNGQSQFKTWLLSISRFKLADHMRRSYSQSNLKATYQEEIQNVLAQEDDKLSLPGPERLASLLSCLEKLPLDAKEIIKSRYFNSETVMGLAERLNSSENAISSKLFRLKKKLKTCIELS